MQLDPYLHFNGNCEEAFKLYEKALGGKITFKTTYGEAPKEAQSSPDFNNKIMHMRHGFERKSANGQRCACRSLSGAARIFAFDQHKRSGGSGPRVQRSEQGWKRHHADSEDFLVASLRHVHRSVRHSVDGEHGAAGFAASGARKLARSARKRFKNVTN